MPGPNPESPKSDFPRLDRRELLAYTAVFGSSFLAAQGLKAEEGGYGQKSEAQPATK